MLENTEEIFSKLNDKLKEKNLQLNIICVGGYVLKYHGIRETRDIDGFFNNSPDIRKLIREIGDEFHINQEDEDWLNNSVGNLNEKPNDSICQTIYSDTNLKIMIPPLEYVAGMKLRSEREVDIIDVSSIIIYLNIESPRVFQEKLNNYGFNDVDESLILEAFSEAYGMDWLEDYYFSEETAIIDSVKDFSSRKYNMGFVKTSGQDGQENTIPVSMAGLSEKYHDTLHKLILCKYEALREDYLAERMCRIVDGNAKAKSDEMKVVVRDIVDRYKSLPNFKQQCKDFSKTKEGKAFIAVLRKMG